MLIKIDIMIILIISKLFIIMQICFLIIFTFQLIL